jgi:hypothetical protein
MMTDEELREACKRTIELGIIEDELHKKMREAQENDDEEAASVFVFEAAKLAREKSILKRRLEEYTSGN